MYRPMVSEEFGSLGCFHRWMVLSFHALVTEKSGINYDRPASHRKHGHSLTHFRSIPRAVHLDMAGVFFGMYCRFSM
jgi:hypothetical protein